MGYCTKTANQLLTLILTKHMYRVLEFGHESKTFLLEYFAQEKYLCPRRRMMP